MVIFHFANCQRLPEANSPYHHKQTMVFVGDISILFLWFICTNCSITGVHHTIVSIDISPAKTIVLGVICTHQLSVNSSLGHHLAIPSQPLRVVCSLSWSVSAVWTSLSQCWSSPATAWRGVSEMCDVVREKGAGSVPKWQVMKSGNDTLHTVLYIYYTLLCRYVLFLGLPVGEFSVPSHTQTPQKKLSQPSDGQGDWRRFTLADGDHCNVRPPR